MLRAMLNQINNSWPLRGYTTETPLSKNEPPSTQEGHDRTRARMIVTQRDPIATWTTQRGCTRHSCERTARTGCVPSLRLFFVSFLLFSLFQLPRTLATSQTHEHPTRVRTCATRPRTDANGHEPVRTDAGRCALSPFFFLLLLFIIIIKALSPSYR